MTNKEVCDMFGLDYSSLEGKRLVSSYERMDPNPTWIGLATHIRNSYFVRPERHFNGRA